MQQTPELHVQEVVDLAVLLQMPLIIFDFETTTFRGAANFAVWEAAFIAALPVGCAVAYEELLDPQEPFDPKVTELCHMTNAQLRGKPTYDKKVLPHFQEYAPKAWFGGFNSKTFDIPAAKDMARKFNQPEPDFKHLFDVRQLHHELLGMGTKKGTLSEIAASYGVHPRGSLHRAPADVALTIETFNAMLVLFGRASVLKAMQELNGPKQKKSASKPGKVNAAMVAATVANTDSISVESLAKQLNIDAMTLSFEVGKAIDERLIRPEVFGVADIQDWLDLALPLAPRESLGSGKLKTILESVGPDLPKGLDYIQLRIGLARNGIAWNTQKPN